MTEKFTMDLKQQFQQDMRDAMRAHHQARVNVIRMLLAAFEHAQEAMENRLSTLLIRMAPISRLIVTRN